MKQVVKILTILLFAGVFLYALFSLFKISTTFAPDFSIFYNSAKDVTHHTLPYIDKKLFTQFNYPLCSLIPFLPLILFPYTISQSIFVFVSFLSIFADIFLCFSLLKKKVSFYPYILVASLVLLSFPVKFTLGMGQTNLVAFCFLLGGFVYRKNMKVSILCFVLSFLFKPILLSVLIVLLLQRKWKIIFWSLLFFLLLFLIAPVLFGLPQANMRFFQTVLHQSFAGREIYYNQGIVGFISRLTTNLALRYVLGYITMAVVFVLFLFKARGKSLISQLSFFLTILVLIDPLSWQHHFVFLLFPFLFLFNVLLRTRHSFIWEVVLLFGYIMVSWNIKNPTVFLSFPRSLLLSHVFFGATILFMIQLFLKPEEDG